MEAEGAPEFVKASFIDPQSRSGASLFEFESGHRHSIVLYYYLAFGLAECLPLLALGRAFRDAPGQPARLWRFFLYAGAPLFLVWGGARPLAPLQRLWRDRRARPNVGAYAAAVAAALALTALLAERHSAANALLALRGKALFAVGLRALRRFPLKGRELRFAALFGCYLACLALAGRDALVTLLLVTAGGLAFFLAETLFALGLSPAESEALTSAAQLLLALLFLLRAAAGGRALLAPAPLEPLWAALLAGSSFARFWLLKRLKHIQNDSTAEAYGEVLIVFVGAEAVVLSLLFGGERRWAVETVVALLGLAAFVAFREKELRGLLGGARRGLPPAAEQRLMD